MKRPLILLFVLVALLAIFWSSCTRDQLKSTCDTTNMSYTNNIVPILKNNCYSCHSTGNSAGSIGILLDDHDRLKFYADNGQLLADITHTGGVPMPYMKPKLDSCSINQISAWIIDGALNN